MAQNPESAFRGQLGLQGPGEHAAGEAVHYSMQITACAIEEADDRDVDVEPLVGSTGTDSDFGLGRVESFARSAPTVNTQHSAPGPVAGEDGAKTLGVKRYP